MSPSDFHVLLCDMGVTAAPLPQAAVRPSELVHVKSFRQGLARSKGDTCVSCCR